VIVAVCAGCFLLEVGPEDPTSFEWPDEFLDHLFLLAFSRSLYLQQPAGAKVRAPMLRPDPGAGDPALRGIGAADPAGAWR
jgi:hypothetical protein